MIHHLVNALCDPPKLAYELQNSKFDLSHVFILSFFLQSELLLPRVLIRPIIQSFYINTKFLRSCRSLKVQFKNCWPGHFCCEEKIFLCIFIMGLASIAKWLMRTYVGESGLKCPWLLTPGVIWKFQAHWNAPLSKLMVNCMHEFFVSLRQHLLPTLSSKVCKNEVKQVDRFSYSWRLRAQNCDLKS